MATFTVQEIASLSCTGGDARYFQISLPVQPGNSGGAGGERGVAGERELRGEEQLSPELSRIRAGGVGEVEGARDEGAEV